MSVVLDPPFETGYRFLENFAQPFGVVEMRGGKHLPHCVQRVGNLVCKDPERGGKVRTICLRIIVYAVHIRAIADTACVQLCFDGQLPIGMRVGIHIAEGRAEQSEIGNHLRGQLRQSKAKTRVGDAVGLQIVRHGFHPADGAFAVLQNRRVVGDVVPVEYGDAVQFLVSRLSLLVFAQRGGVVYDRLYLFRREGRLVRRQLFGQLCFIRLIQTRNGNELNPHAVVAGKKLIPDQVFIIPGADLLPERII